MPTLIGFVAGIALTRAYATATIESALFTDTSSFAVWSILVGFECALWLNIWIGLQPVNTQIKEKLINSPFLPSLLILLLFALLIRVALYFYPSIDSPLYGQFFRSQILHLGTFAALLPGALGAWRIRVWLNQFKDEGAPDAIDSRAGPILSDLLFAGRALQQFLLFSSAVVVVAVLRVGAFRNAFLDYTARADAFPVDLLLLYGLLFTIVLSFIYLPILARLAECKRQVRETLYPMPDDGRPNEDWYNARDRLGQLLQISRNPIEKIQSTLPIFGPLLGSILALFLPGIGI